MAFRIGMHLGDIIVEGDDLYGVNIAARLEGIAERGGICISRQAYDRVQKKLALGYHALGPHLKNMPEPVKAFAIQGDGLAIADDRQEIRHKMMGQAYDVRGDVEHLHENKHLEVFDRNAMLEEIVEYIARSALVRVLLDRNLWPHFANTPALRSFWALDDRQRGALWGAFINPYDAPADFDPQFISDAQLGRI